ncbi:MAG: membrane-like protein [bacterium]|nr:membrane-like protein [bacterium]
MRRAALLATTVWLTACNGAPDAPIANASLNQSNSVAPTRTMQADIADKEIVPGPIAVPSDKPLVSRETSSAPSPPPRPVPTYRAIGTEPFWAVTVRGAVATLERPDKPPLRFAVSRSDDARVIRYLGDGITLTLTPGPCSDGMSDALWSDRVQIAFGEGTLKGCGGAREDRREDAP